MPHLGLHHDDSIYWVSAKAIAAGDGYRIDSLPQQPWQTKYPPLFPALLSMVWRVNPAFPGNLPLATLTVWLAFPVYVLLLRAVMRQLDIAKVDAWILAFVAALNPLASILSISLMPEMLFATAFLACMLVAERALDPEAPPWLAVVAGVLGGIAFLIRSAALPVFFTAPLCFAFRKQPKRGLLFSAAMLPAIVGWQLWVGRHTANGQDLVTLYYTNYLGFRVYNVTLADLPRFVWYNLDAYLRSVGKLLTFDTTVGESWLLERIVAVAAIAGTIRLACRSRRLQLPAAAVGLSAVLLVWHYPPDPRLLFPLYALFAAGLWTEVRTFCSVVRRSWSKPTLGDPIAAAIGAGFVAALALFITYTHCYGNSVFLPGVLGAYAADLRAITPAYSWVAEHTTPNSNVYAYDDPLIYLYTGRRACSLPIPPKLYYHNDDAGIDRLLRGLPSFSREQHLDYILLTSHDFYRDLHENGARVSRLTIEGSETFQRMYAKADVEIYRRVRP